MKSKIFVWCNSCSPGWHIAMAVAEDGVFLASHVCSDHGFIRLDMGFTSETKHDKYTEHYPDGWELEWVENARTGMHAGLDDAMRLNREQRKAPDAGDEP